MTPPPLAAALDQFNSNVLGSVLYAAGVSDVPKAKNAKVRLWLTLVGDPDRIHRSLAQLTPVARRSLELLQSAGGEMRTNRFQGLLARLGVVSQQTESPYDSYGSRRLSQTSARQDKSGKPLFSAVLEDLLRSGLIWTHTLRPGLPGNAKIGFEGGWYVYIPDEVAGHLPPLPVKDYAVPELVQTLEGSARTCQRDLYLVWSAAREAPLQLVNTGLLRVSDLKRVAGQLLLTETIATGTKENDYRRIFFLRRLAASLGLLAYDAIGNQLQANASPAFISQTPTERVRLSFNHWRDGDWYNELVATVTGSQAQPGSLLANPAPPQLASARRTVLDTLATLVQRAERKHRTTAPWVPLEGISDYLRERKDEFLVDRTTAEERAASYRYYYGAGFYSPYEHNRLGWSWPAYTRNEEAGWNGVERVFIETVLTEGAYWLGLVDLGYAEPVTPASGPAPGGVAAVRLTDMGRWLLLNGPAPEVPEESGRVVVQPNFRIFAFDPIADTVLARLDSFASRQNVERAIEYELTRETLYRAQLNGQSAGQVDAWLQEVTGAPLPQNVARSLEEWQAAYERITVRSRVGWVEAAAPELVEALLNDPRWDQAVVKRATPTGLIVRADRIEEMERALLKAGELPVRNNDPEAARRRSITVDEEGRIGFLHAIPSLYVCGYLRPFSEERATGWQITARSVTQAGAAGLDAAAILSRLNAMAVGGVPPALQTRIKAWSQHYGAAVVQTLTLVQFRDQDALDELRTDPMLARCLTPFKPEARLGLAVVAPDDLASLEALLEERGVEVRR
ncbi:MAG: helicase-associated domain-containing protein [Caldilineales bacterium]